MLKSGCLVPEQGLRDSFGTPPPQVGIASLGAWCLDTSKRSGGGRFLRVWASDNKKFWSSGEPGHLVQIHANKEKCHPPGNLLLRRNHQNTRSSWCLDKPGTIRRCFRHASPWAWAPRTLIALVFSDTLRTKRHYPRASLSSGVGTKSAEIRAKSPWCLDTQWTIRHCNNRSLHGCGHQSVTLSQVFGHVEDDTTPRSAGLSSSVDTQYRKRYILPRP